MEHFLTFSQNAEIWTRKAPNTEPFHTVITSVSFKTRGFEIHIPNRLYSLLNSELAQEVFHRKFPFKMPPHSDEKD